MGSASTDDEAGTWVQIQRGPKGGFGCERLVDAILLWQFDLYVQIHQQT